MRPRALCLGIDLGTSGVRVAALDERGRACGVVAKSWPAGDALNPFAWLRLSLDLIATLTRRLPHTLIEALAIDGTSGTVLLCAPDSGRPLTPTLAYNDQRATHEAAQAAAAGLAPGPAHGAHGGIAKLLWLKTHYDIGPRARALPQSAWLTGAFLGRFRYCDEHNALKLGFDGAWAGAVGPLGLAGHLPEIVAPGTILGRLTPPLTRRLNLGHAPFIVAGTTDSIAALLALGPLPVGVGVSSLGSTLALKLVSPRPIQAPEHGIYSHRLGNVWLAGGASNSGGVVLNHYFTRSELARLSGDIAIDTPTHLRYYPLIHAGERFPINDPELKPRVTPRPASDTVFLQGLLEGLAEIEARGYALLAHHGAPLVKHVMTTGGGARNGAWRTIREQRLGVPVTNAFGSPTALGAARLACQGLHQDMA